MIWFGAVLVLAFVDVTGPAQVRESVPLYLYVASTIGLAVVLYMAYAAFFVLKAVCVLCLATYAAVIGLFIVSGLSRSMPPMLTLPRRVVSDLRALVARPLTLLVALVFLAGAVSAVAFFPSEASLRAVQAQRAARPATDQERSEFVRFWEAMPRVAVPVPSGGAKVVIVKFTDLQCPGCGQAFFDDRPVLSKYQSQYPGAVKFVAMDYPLQPECNPNVPRPVHTASCDAAVAVRLAREHNKGEALEEYFYGHQAHDEPGDGARGGADDRRRHRLRRGVCEGARGNQGRRRPRRAARRAVDPDLLHQRREARGADGADAGHGHRVRAEEGGGDQVILPQAVHAIDTEDLTKDYALGFWRKRPYRALDRLTLAVEPGEVFGLLGPNGAGKTTTLKLLLQLVFPTGGRAEILGRPAGDVSVRRRIGYLPENPYFYDHLTAVELLNYFGRLLGLGGADRAARIPRLLDQVGIGAERRLALRRYSKGMLQRVGLAQALLNEPEVVFLDEPMSGLDPIGRRMVRELILGLRDRGATVFFSSHILSDAEAVCSRVAILAGGRLVASGRLTDLLAFGIKGWEVIVEGVDRAVLDRVRAVAVKVTPIAERRYALELPPSARPDQVMADLAAAGASVVSMNPLRDTLEDFFMRQVAEHGRERQVQA